MGRCRLQQRARCRSCGRGKRDAEGRGLSPVRCFGDLAQSGCSGLVGQPQVDADLRGADAFPPSLWFCSSSQSVPEGVLVGPSRDVPCSTRRPRSRERGNCLQNQGTPELSSSCVRWDGLRVHRAASPPSYCQ